MTRKESRRREQQLNQIMERLTRVEASLQSVEKTDRTLHVNIEYLDAKDLKLEHLDFHFDRLDIDEVSGALNLGNNIGVRVEEKQQGKDEAKQKKRSKKPGERLDLFNDTAQKADKTKEKRASSADGNRVASRKQKQDSGQQKNLPKRTISTSAEKGLQQTSQGFSYKF